MTTSPAQGFASQLVPASAGIGLRSAHFNDVLTQKPDIDWLEVHSENYFGQGGAHLYYLEMIRADYPISIHGVGLSIGSTDDLDQTHLDKLKIVITRFEPALVSEHLSWGCVNGHCFNDLFPLPYTQESLKHMVSRVLRVQDILGRQILIENISSYLQYADSTIPEWEFIVELARHSGCGILLDVNNIYVNAMNHEFDPYGFIRAIPVSLVQEIHLAGFTRKSFDGTEILIDTHNHVVSPEVWALYRYAMCHLGVVPTLIEWDTDLPPLALLLREARRAQMIMDQCNARAA